MWWIIGGIGYLVLLVAGLLFLAGARAPDPDPKFKKIERAA